MPAVEPRGARGAVPGGPPYCLRLSHVRGDLGGPGAATADGVVWGAVLVGGRGADTTGTGGSSDGAEDRQFLDSVPVGRGYGVIVPDPEEDFGGPDAFAVEPRRHQSPFDAPGLEGYRSMSLEEIAASAGLRNIDVVAWRDYDDAEAGGSELHAHRIMSAWAAAGIKVNMTTSTAPGAPPLIRREGYRVTRREGRYSIFPRTIISGVLGKLGRGDGLVEIWNGMPFLSPLWARCPRIVFLHHVHAEMWKMVLPRGLAEFGYTVEHTLAPPVYKRSRIVTLSPSSKAEIVERLGLPPANIAVCPPGVEPRFSPGTVRSDVPLVVAVGRLVPVKRFELMVDVLLTLKQRIPDLQAIIAGEGYERPRLEAMIRAAGAESWISLPGYVDDEGLVDLYRRAWVVASTSLREGWGMTVTEAGACGTPSVASRISGHLDAVVDGQSGLLFDTLDEMGDSLHSVLTDEVLRKRLSLGALDFASQFSWDTTARGALAALAADVARRR